MTNQKFNSRLEEIKANLYKSKSYLQQIRSELSSPAENIESSSHLQEIQSITNSDHLKLIESELSSPAENIESSSRLQDIQSITNSDHLKLIESESKLKFFGEKPINLAKIKEFRSETFPDVGPYAWLDLPNAKEEINHKFAEGLLSKQEADYCHQWITDGFIVVNNLINHQDLDRIWVSYEQAVREGKVPVQPEKISDSDPYLGRFLDPHLIVPEINELLCSDLITKYVKLFFGREVIPFQTITSFKGSQQGVHSDAIHMTTYPLGYMIAAWVAFEDIYPDSGPVVYYPGSHKLPYLFSQDIGLEVGEFRSKGQKVYNEKYEPAIVQELAKRNLKPAYFNAKKGDVLFWHHNLLHGGSPRNNVSLSRKAIVSHYFAKGAICYHDLAGTPANFDRVYKQQIE